MKNKRFWAVLLVVAMMVSMGSMAAVAEEDTIVRSFEMRRPDLIPKSDIAYIIVSESSSSSDIAKAYSLIAEKANASEILVIISDNPNLFADEVSADTLFYINKHILGAATYHRDNPAIPMVSEAALLTLAAEAKALSDEEHVISRASCSHTWWAVETVVTTAYTYNKYFHCYTVYEAQRQQCRQCGQYSNISFTTDYPHSFFSGSFGAFCRNCGIER